MKKSVMEQLKSVVCSHPSSKAVIDSSHSYTYRELYDVVHGQAIQLTRHFKNKNVTGTVYIGVFIKNSIHYINSLLAILLSGHVFVPLDPSLPKQRLSHMIKQAGIKTILVDDASEKKFKIKLSELPNLVKLNISHAGFVQQCPSITADDHQPAYVLFTSGSTGQPKGVIIGQPGLVNMARQVGKRINIQPQDRILAFANIMFDAHIYEIFSALLNGATLVMTHANNLAPAFLANTIRELQITHVTLTPTILSSLSPESMPTLKSVVSAAEPCSKKIQEKWIHGPWSFYSGYGPTEATVCVMMASIKKTYNPELGSTIEGITAFVLDENLHPVRENETGELCLAGIGLAQGYLNAAITKQSFIEIPSHQLGIHHVGADLIRIYRTGDRVRYINKDHIEFVGRKDCQINLNGCRIELGDIESALNQIPNIVNSVVMAKETDPVSHLVAYYVPCQLKTIKQCDIIKHLMKHVPHYMIPSYYIEVEQMPLTPNNKIDKKKLSSLKNKVST